jgi:hypothetical protein
VYEETLNLGHANAGGFNGDIRRDCCCVHDFLQPEFKHQPVPLPDFTRHDHGANLHAHTRLTTTHMDAHTVRGTHQATDLHAISDVNPLKVLQSYLISSYHTQPGKRDE